MKHEVKHLISAVVVFAVMLSACYLFGYWGYFKINPLEFLSFTDLIRFAIKPLVSAIIFVGIGQLLAEITGRNAFPAGGGANSPIAQKVKKHWRIPLGILVVIACAIYFIGPEPNKWLIIGILASLVMSAVAQYPTIVAALPNDIARQYVVSLPWLLLGIAMWLGRSDAYWVQRGLPQRTVDIQRSHLPFVEALGKPVAYLGSLGSSHFFYELATNQVIYLQSSDGLTLYFKADDARLTVLPRPATPAKTSEQRATERPKAAATAEPATPVKPAPSSNTR